MKLLSSRMSVYLHKKKKKKYKCFKAPAFKKWTSHLNAGAHAWVLCDRHRPDVSAMSYLVCGCQEELNNFFNLEKKPSSCFNSPSFPSCMLSPASGGLPVLPPPEQRPTLQQWGSIRKHVCTDADVKKKTPQMGQIWRCLPESVFVPVVVAVTPFTVPSTSVSSSA